MKMTRLALSLLVLVVLTGCTIASAQEMPVATTPAPTSMPTPEGESLSTDKPTGGGIDVEETIPEVVVPAETPVVLQDTGSAWEGYLNSDYGFAFEYPVGWALAEDPVDMGLAGGRKPHAVVLTRDSLRLIVQFRHEAEETMLGPGGRGAGEVVEQAEMVMFNTPITVQALVYEDKVKALFAGCVDGDLHLYIELDDTSHVAYEEISLDAVVQDELEQILVRFSRTATSTKQWDVVGWPGYVVSNPEGAQFDDALILLPEGTGRVGINGTTPELDAEIVCLRDKDEPGKIAHFWGALVCDVPDVNGCQLSITAVRYGPVEADVETVTGWTGTLVSLPEGAQFDDFFVLDGQFGVAFGIESLDPDIRSRLESLRDSGVFVSVSGKLRCGVPDAFGCQIEVTELVQ